MLNAGTNIIARLIQNDPYEVNATAPNVFPQANSHIPAMNCANPPYANPTVSLANGGTTKTNNEIWHRYRTRLNVDKTEE